MTDNPLVDWQKIRALIREKRGAQNQAAFGARYGLSQTQISDLERLATRKLTPELQRGIEKAIGAGIPRISLAELPDPDEQLEPELQRAISLLRGLYHNRAHREHDWRVLMAVLDDQAGTKSTVSKRIRKR